MSVSSALLSPPILFFCLGLGSGLVRSNLDVPQQVAKFLALYLLFALGFKGGVALNHTGITTEVAAALGAALILAVVTPIYVYAGLQRVVDSFNAAAIAATYGSVSAVTFITATVVLTNRGIPFGDYMSAALVCMESPAILVGILLASAARRSQAQAGAPADEGVPSATGPSLGTALREAMIEGPQLLLLGSLVVGLITGSAGKAALEPFSGSLFIGLLCFFLLDMGLLVARGLRDMGRFPLVLVLVALVLPPVNAMLGAGLAALFGLGYGDAILIAVLAASGSYIAVPATVRLAIPEADAHLYFTMSLAITFPFNVVVGIPLYADLIRLAWPLS
ncbi:MAG: sodium-dependent bicarbonate transport family permease [Rhodospirillaceae bacterium]